MAAIDSADRAMRCLDESDWPLIAKLHGDYQSIAIKNTGSELEQQDARMRHVLVEAGKRFGMLFVGYSGRDASILAAFALYDRVMDGRPTPRLVPVQIPNAKSRAFPVLRYSAILLQSMPTAARRIRLSQSTTSAEVREIFKAKECRATAAGLGRELAVFGRDQEILDALAPLGPSLKVFPGRCS